MLFQTRLFTLCALLLSSSLAHADTSLTVTWVDNSTTEDGFTIERQQGTEGTWEEIGDVGKDVLTYTDTTAAVNTPYCYRVAAFNHMGASSYSSPVCATLPVVPSAPSSPGVTITMGAAFEGAARIELNPTVTITPGPPAAPTMEESPEPVP
jgi:hypothetical protein